MSKCCDYSMRSEWEKSFDETRWSSKWECQSEWDRMSREIISGRRIHRKGPEAPNWYISFWVDDEVKCEELKVRLEQYECQWIILIRIEKKGRFYFEGIVRYGIRKSEKWVIRTLGEIIPSGILANRLLYNDWENWYDDYSRDAYYERGEKPQMWHDAVRRIQKRKGRLEKTEKDIKRVRENYENIKRVRLVLREEEKESDTEIDEPDLR